MFEARISGRGAPRGLNTSDSRTAHHFRDRKLRSHAHDDRLWRSKTDLEHIVPHSCLKSSRRRWSMPGDVVGNLDGELHGLCRSVMVVHWEVITL